MGSNSSDSDGSDDFMSNENDVLSMISKNVLPIKRKRIPRQTTTAPLDEDWFRGTELDLGFSLSVKKPKIPVGFAKDMRIHKKMEKLNAEIRQDETEASIEQKIQDKRVNEVRNQLKRIASTNEKYVEYVIKHYDDETVGLKDIRLFGEAKDSKNTIDHSEIDELVSYTGTDLDTVKLGSKHFNKLSSSTKFAMVRDLSSVEMLKIMNNLTCLNNDDVNSVFGNIQFVEFEIFLKDIGIDIKLIRGTYNTDLSQLKTLDDFASRPPVEVSAYKLSLGVNIFLSHRSKMYLVDIAKSSSEAEKIIQSEHYEYDLFKVLKMILITLMDINVHNSSKGKLIVVQTFDNVVNFLLKSMTDSASKNLTKLCNKIISLIASITKATHLQERALSCLLLASITDSTKQIALWTTLSCIFLGLEAENTMSETQRQELLTFDSTSETVIKRLLEFLRMIKSKSMASRSKKFREDVIYFKDLQATYSLLETLILTQINNFEEMKTLNKSLLEMNSPQIKDTIFKTEENTMIPHLLSIFLNELKTSNFQNFDLSSNPILASIINRISNLVFRLEKELTISVMDLGYSEGI